MVAGHEMFELARTFDILIDCLSYARIGAHIVITRRESATVYSSSTSSDIGL